MKPNSPHLPPKRLTLTEMVNNYEGIRTFNKKQIILTHMNNDYLYVNKGYYYKRVKRYKDG